MVKQIQARQEGSDSWTKYNSLTAAARALSVSSAIISKITRGSYSSDSAKGWYFRAATEDVEDEVATATAPISPKKQKKTKKTKKSKKSSKKTKKKSKTAKKKSQKKSKKQRGKKRKRETKEEEQTVVRKAPSPADFPHLEQREPLVFASWNANSIRLRAERNQVKALAKYCREEGVDVLAIQETRTKDCDVEKVLKQMAKQGFPEEEWAFYWNHHPGKRYSGTAFAIRTHCLPNKITSGIDQFSTASVNYHKTDYPNPETEGRIMVAEWDSFYCVNCYIPVSGIGSWPKRERRRLWDVRFTSLVHELQKTKPAVIVGDFNIARTDEDVSHPKFFNGKFKGLQGFPSFTIQERNDFENLLEECDLVDTWREEHPDDKRITWGWNVKGFWAGKMMGLDYALVSKSLQERVVSSIISRKPRYKLDGSTSKGSFHSDHCVIKLQLAESTDGARPAKRRRVAARTVVG